MTGVIWESSKKLSMRGEEGKRNLMGKIVTKEGKVLNRKTVCDDSPATAYGRLIRHTIVRDCGMVEGNMRKEERRSGLIELKRRSSRHFRSGNRHLSLKGSKKKKAKDEMKGKSSMQRLQDETTK